MKIKFFSLASIIYILLVGAFVFYLELGSYTLNLGNFSLDLPVTLWFVLPLLILWFFAVLHMVFYSFLRALKFKNFFKDGAKFENFIMDLLLEKETNISFKTKEFKEAAQFAKTLKTHEKIPNATKINEILDLLDGIKKEEYLNLSKFKLQKNNILFLENEKNHIKSDINYAYSKIKNLSQTQSEFEELAFETLLKKGTYEQIKNIKIPKKSSQILSLIKRFKEGNLELNASEFEILLSYSNLNEKEYLDIAKMTTKLLNPDAILGIFAKIKNENSEALKAYLFLLAEFGLLDELRELIKDDKKFSDFKAFLVLREKNLKIDLNRLIQ